MVTTSPCSSPVFRTSNPHLITTQFSPTLSNIHLHRPNATILSSCSAASPASPTSNHQRSQQFSPPSPRSPLSPSSFYEILGISTSASNQEIKSAYRKLARICHPDVAAIDGNNNNHELSRGGGDEFMRIHAAYETLYDPHKRADYDRKILSNRRSRPLSSYSIDELMASAGSGYKIPRRNWETDQCW